MTVRHSIIMICHNQEEYIKTALESVLCEQVKPYEVIIGDDASTDGTRKIIEEYRAKYPEIIKLVLNENNLGIFANLNNVTPKVSGDVIHFLPGDDWYKPGFLENVNKKIEELSLDPNKSRFLLLPHVIFHYPDGSEELLRNDPKKISKYSPAGLMLRGMVHQRLVGLSRALFDNWPLYPDDSEEIGPWADFASHILFMQYVDQQIVMDCEGPVYRVGVGIASKTLPRDLERSLFASLVSIRSNYLRGELRLNIVDLKYLEFLIKCWELKFELNYSKLTQAFCALLSLLKHDMLSCVQVIRVMRGFVTMPPAKPDA